MLSNEIYWLYLTLLCLSLTFNLAWSKFYDNSDFDLNPFMNPLDLSAPNDLNLNNPRPIIDKDTLINQLNPLDFDLNNNLNDITLTTKKPDLAALSYDLQANQLLEYLNQASLFSLNNVNSNNNNNNFIQNKPLSLNDPYLNQWQGGFNQIQPNMSNLFDVNGKNPGLSPIIDSNNGTKMFSISNSLRAVMEANPNRTNRVSSILNEINGTFGVNWEDKKNFNFNSSPNDPKMVQCLNCTGINNSSECNDFFEFKEVINKFCCQCNANYNM